MKNVGLWGDQGNGMYRNPVLFGDYPDPDAIRVGDTYYMICSEMNYMGMRILSSKDMVNWQFLGSVYERLPGREYETMERYGRGSWAPSLRYHNGCFYIYFCTPEEGLFLARATDPAGEWTLTHIKEVAGWEDPCPYWDKEGRAWLSRSQLGAGPIYLHRMNDEGTELLDEGKIIFYGDGAEGPKWYDTEDGVLLLFPQGGTSMGWQMALRGPSMEGPFESMRICKQGETWINGPHQGALLDTPSGEWWFLHFSHCGVAGRVVYLEPVTWVDGWPRIGDPTDEPYCGQPVWMHKKPDLPEQPICCTPTSDDFSSEKLGLQWFWNHNPVDERWSLSRKPGTLQLKGNKAEADIFAVRNMLTQRLIGASGFVTVRIDVSEMDIGQQAGLAAMGRDPFLYSVTKTEEGLYVTIDYKGDVSLKRQACHSGAEEEWQHKLFKGPIPGNEMYLRFSIQNLVELRLAYSLDGKDFTYLRHDAFLSECPWKGARIGLFTFRGDGWAAFNNFKYIHDGPCGRG